MNQNSLGAKVIRELQTQYYRYVKRAKKKYEFIVLPQ